MFQWRLLISKFLLLAINLIRSYLIFFIKGVSDASIIEKGRNIVSVARDGQCKLFDVGESKCLATVAKYDCIINSCSIVSLSDETMTQLEIPPREESISKQLKYFSKYNST